MAKWAQFVGGLTVAYPKQKEWLLIWKKKFWTSFVLLPDFHLVWKLLCSSLENTLSFLSKNTGTSAGGLQCCNAGEGQRKCR